MERTSGIARDNNRVLVQTGDVKWTYADIGKARELLGWAPETAIDEGLQKFAHWVTDYYAERPVLEV